jgi:hypothetical protein
LIFLSSQEALGVAKKSCIEYNNQKYRRPRKKKDEVNVLRGKKHNLLIIPYNTNTNTTTLTLQY